MLVYMWFARVAAKVAEGLALSTWQGARRGAACGEG